MTTSSTKSRQLCRIMRCSQTSRSLIAISHQRGRIQITFMPHSRARRLIRAGSPRPPNHVLWELKAPSWAQTWTSLSQSLLARSWGHARRAILDHLGPDPDRADRAAAAIGWGTAAFVQRRVSLVSLTMGCWPIFVRRILRTISDNLGIIGRDLDQVAYASLPRQTPCRAAPTCSALPSALARPGSINTRPQRHSQRIPSSRLIW